MVDQILDLNGVCLAMEVTDKCIFHGSLEERFHGVEQIVQIIEKRTTRLENFVISLLIFLAASSSVTGYLLYEMPNSVSKKVEANAVGIAEILRLQIKDSETKEDRTK